MKRIIVFISLLFIIVSGCNSTGDGVQAEKEELQNLLTRFLVGASVDDINMHDRFWAEELIYTGSDGTRLTKPDIMSNVRRDTGNMGQMPPEYGSDEVQIYVYGNTAIVAFKLIALTNSERMEYYNTGTFMKREGEWKAIAWQATRIP